MADQDILYVAMLTDVGAAQLASAAATGMPLSFTHMAVGDGNGVTPIPSKLQTALINENLRLPLNRLTARADRPVIVAELVLPSNVGGWWVREVGLYDSAGRLVAVANYPATFKPTLGQGTGRTQGIRLQILVSSTADITLIDDPTLVTPTLDTVREEIAMGTAGKAARLKTPRKIALMGDATGEAQFDGSNNATIKMTLAESGVAAGSYGKVTVTSKGLVIKGESLLPADIPSLDASKIATGTLSRPTTGNAGSASKWQTGRALSFGGAATGLGWIDGSGDVNIQLALAGLDVSKLISGILPVVRGGTGGNTPETARAALGAGVPSSLYHSPNGFWWDKDTGLFVQWGSSYLGDEPGSMLNVQFNFPYWFDTAPFIVLPVITQHNGGAVAASTVTCALNEASLTTAGFVLSFTEYISQVQAFGVRWIAVGYRVTPM
ncbi:phage tail protein [Pseudomonas fragi]|uniref:phage tail protein n=1 Tax=Pseudomonas fragi TaxID=296 RepID=UPI001F39E477|nr:phage tail protein [Pseudomonas fragi]MCF6764111.1 phage tail protein [Pseudomonas fragi]